MGKFIIIMSLYSISSFLLYFELYWNWDNFQTSTLSLMHHISVALFNKQPPWSAIMNG